MHTALGKSLPPGDDYAECWELCDRGSDQSSVAAGPLAGATLGSLVQQRGSELLGRHHPQPRFPLLIKLLDAHRELSIQVHPDDARAAELTPSDLGKTEAWVVLAAEPGSAIYAGLAPGVDRAALARAAADGTIEQCLHKFEPRVGDCVFIPAGTVHALGAGLVIAEVQQSSDVTYRLFDWNRTAPDGRPRALHVEQSLDAIDYEQGPVDPVIPRTSEQPGVEQLVACDKFVIERHRVDHPTSVGGDERCRVLVVLEGAVRLAGDPVAAPLGAGATALVPASLGAVQLEPATSATFLSVYLP